MGYYELRTKQEQVIRHFVRGNDGFVSLPTGSRKSLCYSLLLWSFRRSFVFNSTATDQGNTPPPFSQFISCCLQYNRIEIACLPCDIKMTSRILNSSVSQKPGYSDQTFFSPSPARRERLARETSRYAAVIFILGWNSLPPPSIRDLESNATPTQLFRIIYCACDTLPTQSADCTSIYAKTSRIRS